jgi:hypothetical protein
MTVSVTQVPAAIQLATVKRIESSDAVHVSVLKLAKVPE